MKYVLTPAALILALAGLTILATHHRDEAHAAHNTVIDEANRPGQAQFDAIAQSQQQEAKRLQAMNSWPQSQKLRPLEQRGRD